jgi:tetratricopeptide (TPR) repeat protein
MSHHKCQQVIKEGAHLCTIHGKAYKSNRHRSSIPSTLKQSNKRWKNESSFNRVDEKKLKREQKWETVLYFQYKKDYKRMLEEAKKIHLELKTEPDHYSCLLYAKALVLRNQHEEANNLLDKCIDIMSKSKISYKDVYKNFRVEMSENQLDGMDEVKTFTQNTRKATKMTKWNEFKVIMSSYATVAALYSQIGNQKSAEEVYGIYASIVDKFYGNNSIDSANCFYCVGVFYIEQEMNEKAKKCFEKAMYIMNSIYKTEMHPSVAD